MYLGYAGAGAGIGMLMGLWALPLKQLLVLIFYIQRAEQTSDYRAFIETISSLLSGEREDDMETISNQLKREGFEKGLQQRVDLGIKAGEQRIARQMLKNGMQQQVRQIIGLSVG